MNFDNAYKVKIAIDKTMYWDWCCDNASRWAKKIGLMGSSATYLFINHEDALAFKIRFGL